MSAQATQAGVILGTAAYMSPEQARGKPVDKRADVWAFGVVLFELLTGRQLFAGETVSDTLAGVLKTEVDFGMLPGLTPAAIRRLLGRCLERDPKLRLRDIGEARIVLASGGEAEPAAPSSFPASSWRRIALWTTAGIAFGERLAYLPLLGGCLLAGLAAQAMWIRVSRRRLQRGLLIAAGALLLTAYAATLIARDADWQDTEAFTAALVAEAPDSAHAHRVRGDFLAKTGRATEAEAQFVGSRPQVWVKGSFGEALRA